MENIFQQKYVNNYNKKNTKKFGYVKTNPYLCKVNLKQYIMKFMSLLAFTLSVTLFIVSVYANIHVFAYIAIFAISLSALVFFMEISEKKSKKIW
jgi:hypothetical protein